MTATRVGPGVPSGGAAREGHSYILEELAYNTHGSLRSHDQGAGVVTKREAFIIQVVGDPMVDWMLISPTGPQGSALQFTYQWEARATIGVYAQPGGSALLSALLRVVCSPEESPGLRASSLALNGRRVL